MDNNKFTNGCLTAEKHGPLMAGIDKYAAIAGISTRYVRQPIKFDLTTVEMATLKNIKRLSSQGMYGMIYVGGSPADCTERLMALTGCMLRNYVDARFMPLEGMLKEYKEHASICKKILDAEKLTVHSWISSTHDSFGSFPW